MIVTIVILTFTKMRARSMSMLSLSTLVNVDLLAVNINALSNGGIRQDRGSILMMADSAVGCLIHGLIV